MHQRRGKQGTRRTGTAWTYCHLTVAAWVRRMAFQGVPVKITIHLFLITAPLNPL
jgi:hypothetical protein